MTEKIYLTFDMNIYDNGDECYNKWYDQFHNFITQTNLELIRQNISVIPDELLLFNKFIFYLWGSSLDETIAFTLDCQLDMDSKIEFALKPYALTFSRGTGIDDSNSVSILIIARKSQYKDCLGDEPANINLDSYNYSKIIDLAYDNMAKTHASYNQQFINIYNNVLHEHHTLFLQAVSSFFNESKSLGSDDNY
ncbi:MAG: hypothetical protein HN986_09775 [Candidatus Marinimicrobia bacterium]|jgi:hypothetical protein|nr:hypothetical protein [Candidatus Neomarinimicrobiota bacterium]